MIGRREREIYTGIGVVWGLKALQRCEAGECVGHNRCDVVVYETFADSLGKGDVLRNSGSRDDPSAWRMAKALDGADVMLL